MRSSCNAVGVDKPSVRSAYRNRFLCRPRSQCSSRQSAIARLAAQRVEIDFREIGQQCAASPAWPALRCSLAAISGQRDLQTRQDLVAQEVAVKAAIGIRWIFDPLQLHAPRIVAKGRTVGVQQGPCQPAGTETANRANTGDAGRTAAAHKIQQQRFGLVFAMMRAQQPVVGLKFGMQSGIARFPGRRFRSLAGFKLT